MYIIVCFKWCLFVYLFIFFLNFFFSLLPWCWVWQSVLVGFWLGFPFFPPYDDDHDDDLDGSYLPIVYDSMIMTTLITTSLIHLYHPLYWHLCQFSPCHTQQPLNTTTNYNTPPHKLQYTCTLLYIIHNNSTIHILRDYD